jgi:hypothetical protein
MILAVAVWSHVADARAPGGDDLAAVLSGLAERVQQYYDRIGSIICVETVTQQELKFDLRPTGKPRVTVYELSVTRETGAKGEQEFRVNRTLQMVNGKPARKYQEPECTDPKTGTPEPLAFLLARNQQRFSFSKAADVAGGPDRTVALNFVLREPERVNIRWKGDCFDAEGGGIEGRLWFDPLTFDVLQIEARLPKPFLVPINSSFGAPQPAVRVERSEMLFRFTRVKFQQPDEEVLLPQTIEVVTRFRGVPSLKTVQVLSDFRRFLSQSVVRPAAM